MSLLNQLSLLIKESTGWTEKVFQSEDHEELMPLIKLFGDDIHELYNALDKRGKGEDFLNHIFTQWEQERALEHIINALGGIRNWNRGMVDDDLMNQYVIGPYLDDMRYIKWGKSEKGDDRIILELLPGEEAEFFSEDTGGRSYDCRDIAKQIFGDGLEFESYDAVDSIENLIKELSTENYIKLVRYIGIEYQNQEVDAWREEFEGWREEDQLPDGKVFLTPERMNGFLPDDESSRYALAVLISNTPELDEIEGEINNSYSRAWNEVVMNQYYTEYYKAFDEFLGKPIGEGTTNTYKDVMNHETGRNEWKNVKVPVKYFDVTDRARAMIVRHAHEIDNPEDFISMIKEFNMDILCPDVDDYPWDDDEVNDLFQDYLWDYL
mgnify:FL=1